MRLVPSPQHSGETARVGGLLSPVHAARNHEKAPHPCPLPRVQGRGRKRGMPRKHDRSRHYHDRVARQYDSIYDDPYWRFHDELTWRLMKPHLPRDHGAACADLGCGTGKWGLKLLKSGFVTTFLDSSAAMIEQVRAKLGSMGPRA